MHEVVGPLRDGMLILTVVCAAVWDVRARRVPNLLVAGALGAALVVQGLSGLAVLGSALAAAAAALALGFGLYAAGVIGAGDAKLLAAVAAFLGLRTLPSLLIFAALAGGVLALASAARQRVVLRALRDSGRLTAHVLSMGMVAAPATPETARAFTLPYAVAIAAGAVAARYL